MLHITTPYGDEYTVDEQGNISKKDHSKSGQWKFIGLMPVNCWHSYHVIPFSRITEEWIKSHSLRYKNQHPKYTVMDNDYGTIRLWGNTKVHGVGSLWFEE